MLIVALLVVFGTLVVQAQGPVKDVVPAVEVAAALGSPDAGIGSPPPAGFTTVYVFTGVTNESDSGKDEATIVNCTNAHATKAVEVRVEIYAFDPGTAWNNIQSIPAGSTRTWSTQSIAAYNDGLIFPSVGYVFQGSGRVLVKQHSEVICNAQVVDADADPPVYVVKLPLYDPYGRLAHELRYRYLPLIRK